MMEFLLHNRESLYEINLILQAALLAYLFGLPSRGQIKMALVRVYVVFLVHSFCILWWTYASLSVDETFFGLEANWWARALLSSLMVFLVTCMHFWYTLLQRKSDLMIPLTYLSATIVIAYWSIDLSLFEDLDRVYGSFFVAYIPFYAFGNLLLWRGVRESTNGVERRRRWVVFLAFGIPLVVVILNLLLIRSGLDREAASVINLAATGIRSVLLIVAIRFYGWIRMDLDAAAQDIFSTMKEPFLLLDSQGFITQTNPAAQAAFGTAQSYEATAERLPIRTLVPQYTSDFSHFEAPLDTLLGPRDYACICIPIRRKDTEVGRVLLLRDVTRERELTQVKSEFTSTVSHELRTPLTSILGFAKLIRKRFETGIMARYVPETKKGQRAVRQIRDNLRIMENEGQRLTRLINDVLDLSKIEAKKLEWNFVASDMNALVRNAVETSQPHFDKKPDVSLVVSVEDELPTMSVDRARIIQVLENLFLASLMVSDSGPVELRSVFDEHCLRLEVSHAGQEIPPEDHGRVFEKYPQADDVLDNHVLREGFGLALSKEIVERHDGRIGVVSNEGQGDTFFVELPSGRSGTP